MYIYVDLPQYIHIYIHTYVFVCTHTFGLQACDSKNVGPVPEPRKILLATQEPDRTRQPRRGLLAREFSSPDKT